MKNDSAIAPSLAASRSSPARPAERVPSHLRVSVVIGAHTRVQYLKRAVESAVRQGAEEVIVVKYAQTPSLDDELSKMGARVVATKEPLPGGKFADGIEVATGEAVVFLDDDDVLLPGKIQRVREVFADPRVVFHANRYLPFTETPPEHGEIRPVRLFETALGNQYWSGLKPVISSCASVRMEMIRPWVDDLRQLAISDHTMFMMAVKARKWIAMDESILTGWHLNEVRGVLRPANSIWYQPGANAQHDFTWMLDLLDSETDGVRETLTPIVAKAIVHLVFLTGDTEFREYRRTMRALLDGVGVRRPLTVGTTLMFGYPLSPKLAIGLSRVWRSLVGFHHNPN